ncbi:hypothetical protein LOK49_LG08G02078 [Camellia lanceoleosa]|uniref:Uncharacterized protein n=1 Tax=Camellia lanceoleosa TaxID=1840588 RepID=A0ACC0GWC0_9ERIC|nr:hypothetical protein LOK49_LG08G02078 [Camellia lanceoleosa]
MNFISHMCIAKERCRLTIPHAVLCREGARVLWSYVDRILGQPSLAAQFEIRQLNLKGARLILGNAIGKAPKDKDLISGKAIVTAVFDRLLEKKHVASKAIESSSSGVVKLDMDSSRNPESGEDRRVIAPQEACNQIAEVVQEALKKMKMVADEKMRMFKKAHQALEASELELDEKAREVGDAGPIVDMMAVALENIPKLQSHGSSSVFPVGILSKEYLSGSRSSPFWQVDPYLKLMEDIRLHAVSFDEAKGYGSQEDEVTALKSLSTIELGDKQLREAVLSHLMTKLAKLSEDELSGIRKQLLEGFSPDDAYPMGAPLFLETPRPPSPLAQMEAQAFDEVMPLDALTNDESFPEPNGSQSGRKTSLSSNSLDILSVNQLLESVLETARQVASLPVSSTPIPYDQVKNQCESLVMGKQQKMSVLQSFKLQQDAKAIVLANEHENKMPNVTMELSEEDLKLINIEPVQRGEKVLACSLEYGQQQSLRLPPSSPYDKFLKAAGC